MMLFVGWMSHEVVLTPDRGLQECVVMLAEWMNLGPELL